VNALHFEALPPLPARDASGHKGTFGSVLVVGGCAHAPRTMLGGAMLAARGRAGARVPGA
jgi:NAD(P)H-hydrate repair Nnr-like enzyme with NAD(P)H-hydrate dehydratase domain